MPEPTPAVSVIIIYLDAEKYIDEAIASVIGQTFGDWELILVNDGSCDSSPAIAERYATRSEGRIRTVQHHDGLNHGMSASRNLGVTSARAELIAFIDADDTWYPEKLARQVQIVRDQPRAGLVFGQPFYWWDGPNPEAEAGVVSVDVPMDRLFEPPELLLRLYPLRDGGAPCPSDMMTTKTIWESVGGFEEQFVGHLQMYEDQAFLAKVYLEFPVYISSQTWTRYRMHRGSVVYTVTRAGMYESVREYFLRWFAEYPPVNSQRHRAVAAAIHRAMWSYRHPRFARVARTAGHICRSWTSRFRRIQPGVLRPESKSGER